MSRLLLALVAALFVAGAHARDPGGKYANADPAIKKWFSDQHNSLGQWCCNDADGHEYDGNYTINSDGSVTLEYEGKPHWMPAYKVLTGPNPTGYAVWWYLIDDEGQPTDYCFSPGPQG